MKILLDDREEDASLKNEESDRIVALHSALIDREAFLDYVDSVRRDFGEGPLFPMLKPDRDGRRGNPASRRISKWMRNKLKIKDKRIAPNHSWRHTFQTVHRNELEPPTREDIVNSITGHSQGSWSGRCYGVFEMRRDRIELEKLPAGRSRSPSRSHHQPAVVAAGDCPQTQHAGRTTLSVSSTHGEQHTARRVYVRIARFFASLRDKRRSWTRCSAGIASSARHCENICTAGN